MADNMLARCTTHDEEGGSSEDAVVARAEVVIEETLSAIRNIGSDAKLRKCAILAEAAALLRGR